MPTWLEHVLTALSSALLVGLGAYIALVRQVMTKREHKEVCSTAQKLVQIQIEAVKKQQEDHGRLLEKVDRKLDRIIERMIPGGGSGST